MENIPCTTTLYNWIDKGFLKIKNIDLLYTMGRKTKKKRERNHRKILGDSIEKRSEIVATREEFGYWEINTVLGIQGDQEPILLTLTEQKTRFEYIIKINSKTACAVNEDLNQLKKKLGSHFSYLFRTITSDKGSEFSELSDLFSDETKVYLSHTYSSWQRGTNENHNKMIRRFIAKGKIMSDVSQSSICAIQQLMTYQRKYWLIQHLMRPLSMK